MIPGIPIRRVFASDLQATYGGAMVTAYRRLKTLKKDHHIVTNYETAEFVGLSIEDFEEIIRGN
jgi:hypothetical protein